MNKRYENLSRGTKDFPLAKYKFSASQENLVLAQTHFHNELEILYISKGEITLILEGESMKLKSGDVAFINPNEYHALKSTNQYSKYTAFVFKKDLITFPPTHFFQTEFTTKIFQGKSKLPTIVSEQNPLYSIIATPIIKMQDSANTNPQMLPLLLEIFTAFLNHNALIKVKTKNKKIPDYVKLCIDYIAENCHQNINLTNLSNIAHVSPNHLCSAFKSATGITPIEHLQVIRIKKAAHLLIESDLSVEEISQLCGFQNVGYFIRIFKKHHSLTPLAFRKK